MSLETLVNLPNDSLASQVAAIQERLGFPGLVHECKSLMKTYSLSNVKSHSKVQWKNAVKKAIVTANQNYLVEKAKNYKKIDYLKLSQEKGGIKPYIRDLNVPR